MNANIVMSFVLVPDVHHHCSKTNTIGAGGSVLKLGLSQISDSDRAQQRMVLYKAGLAM